MKLSIKILVVFTLFLASFDVNAQKFTIRGIITDAETNEPLLGVNIVEVSQENRFLNGTISNFNGEFMLEVTSENSRVEIKYIGYKSEVLEVKGQEFFTIKLTTDVKVLEGVDIVTQRIQQSGLAPVARRDDASSKFVLNLDEMSGVGATSSEDLLQGAVPGLDIVMNSGDPGSGSSLIIRGMGSLGGAQPLIVIDDIPQDIKSSKDFSFASADIEDIGALVSIPPNDIADIQVLKDASATAMYGSRGANGVLIITTKRGSKSKPKFDFIYKMNYDKQPSPIPLLNGDEYVTLQLEQLFNPTSLYDLPVQLAYEKSYYDYYNYAQNTDWLKEVTRNPLSKEYAFSVRGGGDKSSYYISINYTDEEGTTTNTDLERLTNRINLDYRISNNLRVSANFSYVNSSNNRPFEFNAFTSNPKGVREIAYTKAPNMSVYEYDANGILTGRYFSPIVSYQGSDVFSIFNPVAISNLSEYNLNQNEMNSDLNINYSIGGGFSFKGTISYQYISSGFNSFLPREAIGTAWTNWMNNNATQEVRDFTTFRANGNLTYRKEFAEIHSFVGNATYEISQTSAVSSTTSANQTASNNLTDPAAVSQLGWMWDWLGQSRTIRATSFLQYKLKDKYSITLNGSLEGSSRFGADKRWGLFPSVSGFWRFGSEPFLNDVTFIGRDARLKASWGITGNSSDIGNYNRFATYVTGGKYIDNTIIIPNKVQLDNIQWEIGNMTNIALEVPMFNDKVMMTLEVYKTTTSNVMFEKYKIPTSSGYDKLANFNGGKIENKGIEFFVSSVVKRWGPKSRNSFSLDMNLSHNVNLLLEAPPNFINETDATLLNGKYPRVVNTGVPIGSFYGLEYLGVYSTSNISVDDPVGSKTPVARDANGNVIVDVTGKPLRMFYGGTANGSYFYGGDAMYKDQNHDGVIDILDAVNLGNSNPDVYGGLSGTLKLSQFNFKFQFFGRWGQDIVNSVAQSTQGMNNRDNQSKAVLRRWRWEGMDYDNLIPRAYMNDVKNNLGSTRYVEDGSFLRLNNITLSYEIPRDICTKFNLQKVVFSMNARRLYTFTNYTGQDPEVPLGKDFFWMGADKAKTPPANRFTFTLNVNF